jgi:diguanylate cyclase (GGDEF)-like protein/PAS domain S-box-containing protein
MNILIVDDDPINLKLLRAQLEGEGHAVFDAHDGVDALALLERQRVDAVISDILMPRMDGYSLCHEIRKHARLHDLPIIIYTSTYTSPGDQKLALDMGADKYLTKPVSVETLVAALHEVGAQPHAAPRPDALREVEVLKEYNERLVSKLKEKNTELLATHEELQGLLVAANQSRRALLSVAEDQKHSEAALAESLNLLKIVVDAVPMRIFWKDKKLRYLGCNLAFAEDAGEASLLDVIGKDDYQLVWKEQAELYRANDQQVMDSGIPKLFYDEPQTTPDGKTIWLRTSKVPLHNSGNETIGVLGVYQDVTKQKQTEADLRIAAIAFESQEGMMITDADGVILRVNQAFTKDTGYTAEEAVGQKPHLLKSGRHDAAFYRAMWETINRTGAWQGEIWDRRKNGEIYPKWLTITAVKGDDGVVTHYVETHIDITDRKSAEKEIHLLAFYDPLTQLSNRRLLMDRLHHALASSARIGRTGALLFIDLDNFKTLNDTLGHDIGDLLLQQVAQRLTSCVRDDDTVARLGGDEFVVMLENLSERPIEAAAQTEAIGEKILTSFRQPYQLDTKEYQGTTSIGATLFNGNSQTTDELMKQADIAMYQAKKAGRNTLRFFDQKMQDSITGRFSLEGELRKALGSQQFHLYYQIQVDSSNRPLGAEALIRWIHPLRGIVSPAQFIPMAEETGVILPIGLWVLETACAQLKAWEKAALTRDLVLAVNISAKQFHQAGFVAQVQAVVQHHAINPMRLKLELTEGMLLENIEDTITTMKALNEIGIQFSLDDFGTGYSSLQYLKRLPVDQLKIDQSFVRNIVTDSSDIAIVRTIIAMARSLDMAVIAEGVETEEQRQLLLKNDCTHYQGYLFSKPVPIDQFEALLKQK